MWKGDESRGPVNPALYNIYMDAYGEEEEKSKTSAQRKDHGKIN